MKNDSDLSQLLYFCSLFLFLTVSDPAWSQSVGDYGAYQSGTWSVAGNWKIYNGINWATSPVAATSPSNPSNNVYILSGATIQLTVSSTPCNNLTIEPTGKLYGLTTTNIYLNIYGSIICDGTIGNGSTFDGISFNVEGPNCLFTGNGVVDCSRIRKNLNVNLTTNLIIDINVNLRFSSASQTQIYNNSAGTIFNITVNAGKTLNLGAIGANVGNVSMDGLGGNGFGEMGGSYNINGTLIITGILYLVTDNMTSPVAFNIGSTGIVLANNIIANSSTAATHTFSMQPGGSFQITGTPFTNPFMLTNNIYNFSIGSTIAYSASGVQTVDNNLPYANLILSGSGTKSLVGPTNINGDLLIGSALSSTTLNVNGKYIKVGGNFYNYNGTTTFAGIGASTIEFNGTIDQIFTNTSGSIRLNRVVLNKPSGRLLLIGENSTMNIDSTLMLTSGIIDTRWSNALEVNMKYFQPASLIGPFSAASYIDGKLRRKISNGPFSSPALPASYDFPLGNSAVPGGYEHANITFVSPTLVTDLLGTFNSWTSVPNSGPSVTECFDGPYSGLPFLNNGFWSFKRSGTNVNGRYTISLYNSGFTNNSGVGWTVAVADTFSDPTLPGSWRLIGNCVATSTPQFTQRASINPSTGSPSESFNLFYATVQTSGTCTASVSTTNASCSSSLDGSAVVTLNVQGAGTLPISYSIDGQPNQSAAANPFILSGLAVGTHSVSYVSNSGCSNNAIFSIEENPLDDGNACTIDICSSISGAIHSIVDPNDNDLCTIDGCNTIFGVFHLPASEDYNVCSIDFCSSINGNVSHTGIDVDDLNSCTADGCDPISGIFHAPIETEDGNLCTVDACNSTTGIISHLELDSDDNDLCTVDGCNTDSGIYHLPLNLSDENECTIDACVPATGNISHIFVDVNDNDLCTNDGCNSLSGVFHDVVNRDDNNLCTVDVCDPDLGVFHIPVIVDDYNQCTIDGCSSISGVFHTLINISDNNLCSIDICNSISGAISHEMVDTDDNNICTIDGCNSISGSIYHSQVNVNDNNACTFDGCDSSTGIFNISINVDDNDACTMDACNSINGIISHSFISLDDNNSCTVDACNSLTGAVTHISLPVDDFNACTSDNCDSSTGIISHQTIITNDNDVCTIDGCISTTGVFHTPVIRDDNNACTFDVCDPLLGIFHVPILISDGNSCTEDICNSLTGAISHFVISIDDNNACTIDICNSVTGSINHNLISINDNDACTIDACQSLSGVISHTVINFNDNNVCTNDGCNSVTGIFHLPVNRSDSNVCTIDGCDPIFGIFHVPVSTNDNNFCTLDGCNSLTGLFHSLVAIEDNDPCTTDGCNSLTGVFHLPSCVTLNLKVYIQGYYTGSGLMDNHGLGGYLHYLGTNNASIDDVDTILVSAIEANTLMEIETSSGILQTNGNLVISFSPAAIVGASYFIRIGHRNSFSTWSRTPIVFSTQTYYDFTISSLKAYDDGFSLPMILIDLNPERWAIINGDINRDGAVDATDMSLEEIDTNAGSFGYNVSDLNGDGASDALDMVIIEINSNVGVFEAHP